MSPAERATAADLARLGAEIRADRAAMERCTNDVRETLAALDRGDASRPTILLGAVALHGWYTGLETLLERAARRIDGSVPAGAASHRDLLSQAMTEIPSLRPAILSRAMLPDLAALLGFRHFFRHAYGVDPDPVRLRLELERLVRIEGAIASQLEAWLSFLDASREGIESSD